MHASRTLRQNHPLEGSQTASWLHIPKGTFQSLFYASLWHFPLLTMTFLNLFLLTLWPNLLLVVLLPLWDWLFGRFLILLHLHLLYVSLISTALFFAHFSTVGGEDQKQGASKNAAATAQMKLWSKKVTVGMERGGSEKNIWRTTWVIVNVGVRGRELFKIMQRHKKLSLGGFLLNRDEGLRIKQILLLSERCLGKTRKFLSN